MSLQHHFNISIAQKYGVHVALFLDHMAFWITKNMANNHNLHDGAYWTRNTVEAYSTIFPYLTPKQIRKVLLDCQKYGLINVGNYNKLKYDRTGWYSLTEYAAKLLNISIFPTGQMEVPKRANGIAPQGKPIPITNTVTNKERESKQKSARPKRVPLSQFKPNEEHLNLAKELQVNLEEQLESFRNRHTGKGNLDYEFDRWIKNAHNYLNKNVIPIKKLYQKEEVVRPKLRDWTQERLDREERERLNKIGVKI